MKTTKRYSAILLTAMILLGGGMVVQGLQEYWARQFDPVTFHWHYNYMIGFSFTDWADYETQTESLTPIADSIMITLTEEDIEDPLVLSLTYTCDLVGAEVTALGQYKWAKTENGEVNVTSDPSFVIPTDGTPFSIDPEKMPWGDIHTWEGGQALELIFTVQTSGITEPTGDYIYQVGVSIGTE